MRTSCFLPDTRPFRVAVSVALALSGVSAFGSTTSIPLFQTPSSGVGLKASSQSRQGNNALNGMVPLFSTNQTGGQADGNTETNGSGLDLAGGGVGLRPVFAGQLGDGKTLVLFQNREGQFFASVVPLFNQAQLQSQMNGGAGQVSAQAGNGASEQAAQSANGGSSSRQTGGGTTASASTGAQSDDADQKTSSAGEEERSAGATQQTGVNDQSRRSSGSSDREEDASTVPAGGSAQSARDSGDSGSSHASGTTSGTSGAVSASGQTPGRPAASSYMGVTDAPADDTVSTSSGDGESTSVAQNDSADTGSSDSSGGESSASESSSRGSDRTSSGSHASGSTSGSGTSDSGASGSGTSDSAGHADSSSGTGGASRPLYTPTTSPSFGSGNTSGDDATETGQGGDTSSGSSDEADGQDGSTSGSSAGSDDSGSSSGSASSQGNGSAGGELPAGTTSDVLDRVNNVMTESSDKLDRVLGEYHDNYDQYTNPDAAGDSVCATPDAMIKHQTESQGYLANVNPSWTWSHAGHANSALGGWDHWPADERGHLTEFKDVPGKWNRLMPWFVISRVSGSHVAADIEVRNMAVYWFPKKDKQWHLLAANLQPDAAICTPDDVNMSRCKSTFSGKATTGTQNAIHGWFTHVEVPDGAQAISVAVEARLVKGGPALMTVAGDYYPPDTVSLGGKFVPGAAASAPQRLKDNGEWTVVTMTTLTDQTKDDTGISRDMLMKRSPQCKNPARYYRP